MKAKIVEVKKIVKKGPSGGTPPPGGGQKPPKNIEQYGEDDDELEDYDMGDDDGEEGEGKEKEGKKGKGKKGEKPEDDMGDDAGEEGEGKDKKSGKPEDKQGKGSGSGEGEEREWKEVDPKEPGEYKVTPWTPPSNRTIIGETLPTGSLGDGETSAEKSDDGMKEKWKNITTAAEASGDIPGGIRAALERMRAPVVDWRKELEVFIDSAISKSKYTLPARRFLGAGEAQYGYKRYKEDLECIVVAIDTSGSISDHMVEQFISEVKAIVEAYSPQDLYILYFHTRVYNVDHFTPGEPIEVGDLKSGGTDFFPMFEWTEENLLSKGITPSAFIVFTDGEATFPTTNDNSIGEYEDKVLWVLLTWNGQPFRNEVPFGGRIDITLPNKEVESI